MERADGAPIVGADSRQGPAGAKVGRAPHTLGADGEHIVRTFPGLADLGDERRVARPGIAHARGGRGPAHATVNGALQAVVLITTHDLLGIIEMPARLVAIAADAEIPEVIGHRVVRRLPGAVVLHATDVLAGTRALVHAVELGRDHAVGRDRKSGHAAGGAGDATIVGAQQVPTAARRLHDFQHVVIRVREAVARQSGRGVGFVLDVDVQLVELRSADKNNGRIRRVANDRIVIPALSAQPVVRTAGIAHVVPRGPAIQRNKELR